MNAATFLWVRDHCQIPARFKFLNMNQTTIIAVNLTSRSRSEYWSCSGFALWQAISLQSLSHKGGVRSGWQVGGWCWRVGRAGGPWECVIRTSATPGLHRRSWLDQSRVTALHHPVAHYRYQCRVGHYVWTTSSSTCQHLTLHHLTHITKHHGQ